MKPPFFDLEREYQPGCIARFFVKDGESETEVEQTAQRFADCFNGVPTLFDAIAHGDEGHRAWLKGAIERHFTRRMTTTQAQGGEGE